MEASNFRPRRRLRRWPGPVRPVKCDRALPCHPIHSPSPSFFELVLVACSVIFVMPVSLFPKGGVTDLSLFGRIRIKVAFK